MKINQDRFRAILREEARRMIYEAQAPVQSVPKSVSMSPLGKADTDALVKVAKSMASKYSNPLTYAKSGLAKTAITTAAEMLPSAGGVAAGEASAGAAFSALAGAGSAGVGATALALAPFVLVTLGTMGLVGIADAAWDAKVAEVEAMDRDTATACTSAKRNAYTAAIIRGKSEGMWTSDQLKLPGQAMNKKLTKSGRLTTEEGSALAIVLAAITADDIEKGYASALQANPAADKEEVQKDKTSFSNYISSVQKEVKSKISSLPKSAPAPSAPPKAKPAIS